jgi:hypothetical protein
MHDARNEQTNHWSVHVTIYYPMINDPVSTEVQYSIVLLFEWLPSSILFELFPLFDLEFLQKIQFLNNYDGH